MISKLEGLVPLLMGMIFLIWCVPIGRKAAEFHRKWGGIASEKANQIMYAVVGLIFILWGLLVLCGLIK